MNPRRHHIHLPRRCSEHVRRTLFLLVLTQHKPTVATNLPRHPSSDVAVAMHENLALLFLRSLSLRLMHGSCGVLRRAQCGYDPLISLDACERDGHPDTGRAKNQHVGLHTSSIIFLSKLELAMNVYSGKGATTETMRTKTPALSNLPVKQ